MARPPSSFRLLPLPEEDSGRPSTGLRLSAQASIDQSDTCHDLGKLPQISLPSSARASSSRTDKRQQFRASSLSDVLEVCELDKVEANLEPRFVHSSPKERKISADPALSVTSTQSPAQEKAPKIKRKSKSVVEPPTSLEPEASQRSQRSEEESQLQMMLEDLRDAQHADKNTIIKKMKNFYQFVEECSNKKLISKR